MRTPKTGRTASRPAEPSPASLVWTEERCAILAAYLFRFIEVTFGSDVAKRIWAKASRKPRERSIKQLSDGDLGLVRRYLAERQKAEGENPQPTRNMLARRVAQAMTPENARALGINTYAVGGDFLRAVTLAVIRRVTLYEKYANGHRTAAAALDPESVVLNIDRLPLLPE
ncbi:hypothetical protein JMJ56_19555 [Belnapia sp. T18]|uniref:Uncharacterized protein n=1 Tax=Belnapia arida TaxID=2804533 RepID=A0ABS1U6E3_9PROT|nr:hypothetical protein [Belnapia arida]MBL6080218.1 hypothetical protein [Belnapia arida]